MTDVATEPTPDSKALIAGVVGAVVATATDMAVHATPMARAAGIVAATAGGVAAFALEHGGVIDAAQSILAPKALPLGETGLSDCLSQATSDSGFVDDYTASGGAFSIFYPVCDAIGHAVDILGRSHSGLIIDPVEPGALNVDVNDCLF